MFEKITRKINIAGEEKTVAKFSPKEMKLLRAIHIRLAEETRRTLEELGVPIPADADAERIKGLCRLANIRVEQVKERTHEKEAGWYVYKRNRLVRFISHPYEKDGRIKFKSRSYL